MCHPKTKCALVELCNVAYVELGFPFVTGTIYFDSAALFRQIIHKMLRNAGAPKVRKATKENINICLESTL